jgi:hypothetical protein
MVRVDRLVDRPIVGPTLDHSIGQNIQGPSLIRVPDWVTSPLGRYYLYFAHHKGVYIRLAAADNLEGPWRIHRPGTLHLKNSGFLTKPPEVSQEQRAQIKAAYATGRYRVSHDIIYEVTTPHIASPEVHVDEARQRIRMYFHGLEGVATQVTRVAESRDGINFEAHPQVLGRSYMRVFEWDGFTYAMSMPGQFYRSRDGLGKFEQGPLLFNPNMRHAALLVRGTTLSVFWTQVGDTPERIMLSTIDLSKDWLQWQESDPIEVLRPERNWEGARAPLEPSIRSTAYGQVNQLRDPAIYTEGERMFLLYAVAGESGIAIAEVFFDEDAL